MKFFRFCPLQRTFFILAELGSFVKDFFEALLTKILYKKIMKLFSAALFFRELL